MAPLLLAADAVSATHLPALAERFATERLSALAQAQGAERGVRNGRSPSPLVQILGCYL